MTVYKTLTPDLDVDTIGGAIDLETITAFSYDESFNRVKVETSYSELTKDASNPKLSATFTNRWETDGGEFGAALVLSDQTRRIVAHNNENGGWGDVAPNDDYEMRFYDLERERQGIVLNLDYVTDSGNSYYAHIFHNEYKDTEWRAKWETRDVLEEVEPVINGNVFTYGESKMDTEGKNRTEIREITSIQLGTSLQLSERSKLDVELFSSKAEQDDTDRYNAIFRSGSFDDPIVYDNSNGKQPTVTFPSQFYNPSTFGLKTWETEFSLNTDEDMGAKLDYTFALSDATELKSGFKFRAREKVNSYNFCGYDPVNDSTLADYANTVPAQFLNSVAGPTPTFEQVKDFSNLLGSGTYALSDGTLCLNPGTFFEASGDEEEESIPADWETEEDVLAGYLMATTEHGDATWIYGLRYEDTRTTYRGKRLDDNGFAGNVSFDNDYTFLAPSLNVKYALAEDKLVRFGLFRSLVRPGFQESAAGAIINLDDNEVEGGNPELDPTTAWNLDLSYEYYIGAETFFGAGVFYKDIQDPIVAVKATDVEFRGRVYDVAETFLNAGDSVIKGFEVSYQTAFENGFIFVANYTYSDGETDLPANAANGERTIPFFKQSKHTANLSVGYDRGPWDIRLAGSFRDSYLDDIGDDAMSDRYTDDHLQIDLTLRYEWSENLTITAEAINLNDEPEYYYFGDSSRLSQYDEYGTTYGVGARYNF
jgi:TonB-dependent receptor